MRFVMSVFLLLFFLCACSSLSVVEFDNGAKFNVRVADEPNEWQSGLMFVENLPETEGMLFVFNDTVARVFWMKNTLIPLDMFFLDKDGVVVEVKRNVLPCELDPCEKYPSLPARFVLELNAGVAEKSNISVGSVMTTKLNFPG